jgi:hypothetical protein
MERELVLVPACPPDGGAAGAEVRRLTDGTEILPVFSTPAVLARELGEYQPWVCVPMSAAREIAATGGVERVVLDPALGADVWRWNPVRLAAAAEAG